MSEGRFYVSSEGDSQGPFSVEEIVRKIHCGKLKMTDHIYLLEQKDWRPIVDYLPVASKVNQTSGGSIAKMAGCDNEDELSQTEILVDNVRNLADYRIDGRDEKADEGLEWFVLKGENRYGPFPIPEIVRMLRNRLVYEFDYVWNQTLTTWKRISELDEFAPEALKKMKVDGGQDVEEIFFRRRHARVDCGSSVIIHNNESVWKGSSLEVSAGGAGLVLPEGTLSTGETIYLHFKPGTAVPSFNAVCDVISRRQLEAMTGQPLSFRYGVKFKTIGKEARKAIYRYTQSKINDQVEKMEQLSNGAKAA